METRTEETRGGELLMKSGLAVQGAHNNAQPMFSFRSLAILLYVPKEFIRSQRVSESSLGLAAQPQSNGIPGRIRAASIVLAVHRMSRFPSHRV